MGNSAVRERHQLDDFGPTSVKASNCGSEVDLKISDVTSEGSSCSNLSDVEKGVNSLPTVFKWEGPGKTVYLSGSFDNWKTKIPLVKSRHNLYTIVELPEGTHEYKFFVDGQWLCDDKECLHHGCVWEQHSERSEWILRNLKSVRYREKKSIQIAQSAVHKCTLYQCCALAGLISSVDFSLLNEKVQNTFGTYNNTVTVKPSDFEVFEALGKDCIDSGHPDECAASGNDVHFTVLHTHEADPDSADVLKLKASMRDRVRSTGTRPGQVLADGRMSASQEVWAKIGRRSPPGTYSQSIPSKSNKHKLAPPVLPSQLLQIVLNQEVPKHCDPALLPEPNQVMLNHLYALSIKDGVMILSATYRYRKKYITTVLYRPI